MNNEKTIGHRKNLGFYYFARIHGVVEKVYSRYIRAQSRILILEECCDD